MAVKSTFNAAGAKDVPALRRSISNAFRELASQINADTSGGISTDPATGERIDNDGQGLGYAERFLATRYATSQDGSENFTDDYTTISGTTVFQGLANVTSTTEPTTISDYRWRQINVELGWIPSYLILGGGRILWSYQTFTPDNYQVDDGVIDAIDLGDIAGEVGPAGPTGPQGDAGDTGDRSMVLTLYQSLDTEPTVPTSTEGFSPCLLYTSPSPRDRQKPRMPSSA